MLRNNYWYADYHKGKVDYYEGQALGYWQAGDDHNAVRQILYALDYTVFALDYLIWKYAEYDYGVVPYFLQHFTGEDAVTWKVICEAWVKNDFEGRAWTIAIIDRMRQILWDEPFDIKWAEKPEVREFI